jgi:leucyl/phenylalanyl-tRNA--protein transferase
VGADLAPGTLLQAYSMGIFPMDVQPEGLLGWWSPDPRAVLPLDAIRITKSLRKSMRHFSVTRDVAFHEVMRACSRPQAPDVWITQDFLDAYCLLHDMGWAHSIEVWSGNDLVGGLYGVEIGGLFAGESMFHRVRDASKTALVALVNALGGVDGAREGRVLDVQWRTDHLGSMGAIEIPRSSYLDRIAVAFRLPPALSAG